MDGQSLSSLLHKRGINVRYLGKIATLAEQSSPRSQALRQLSIHEMIARAFKHICNRHLRCVPAPFASSCVAHLLNCLLGSSLNPVPCAETDDQLKSLYSSVDFTFEGQTPPSLQHSIEQQVRRRYRFELGKDWVAQIKPVQMMREVALKLGMQVGMRDYIFSKDSPVSALNGDIPSAEESILTNGMNGHASSGTKRKKKGPIHQSPIAAASPTRGPSSPVLQQTFHADDIVNFVPIVKEASPKVSLLTRFHDLLANVH